MQLAPIGIFRQLTVRFVVVEGVVTEYTAVDPAVTYTVVEDIVGGSIVPAALESTSNCSAVETPPPGVGDCTRTAKTPALAILWAGTVAVK